MFYVAGNLNHDGRAYGRGDTVELSEDAASPLLAMGVIQTEPVPADPIPPANDERNRISPAKPGRKPKGSNEPVVGGEPAQTGEPSIDGQQDAPKSEAKDITPATEEAEKDVSADL